MHACSFAGQQCRREATVTLRIFGIGDRHVCQTHHEWMVAHGMNVRVLGENAFVPEWRQRSLAKVMSERPA